MDLVEERKADGSTHPCLSRDAHGVISDRALKLFQTTDDRLHQSGDVVIASAAAVPRPVGLRFDRANLTRSGRDDLVSVYLVPQAQWLHLIRHIIHNSNNERNVGSHSICPMVRANNKTVEHSGNHMPIPQSASFVHPFEFRTQRIRTRREGKSCVVKKSLSLCKGPLT